MATNTSGGTTTSLDNTVQAKDDYFYADEGLVYCFDVMANDLGGNAKTLWSIDSTSDDGSADLIAKDVVGCIEYSEMGAKISLTSDGKIRYDSSSSAQINALAQGEIAYDQFTYAIRLSNGTLSWATVTVEIVGTNDGPDIFAGSGDSAGADLDETNVALTATGTLSVVDPDTSDVVDTVVTGVVATGNDGGLLNQDLLDMLTITAGADDLAADSDDANNLTWSINSAPEAFDFLAQGQTLTLTYTLTSTDSFGASDTQDVTIVITGTNDGPVAEADTGSAGENESKAFSVLANDTDVDDGAVLSLVSIDGVEVDGSAASVDEANAFSIVGGQVQFTPGTAFDHLAQGDTATVVVSYTMSDQFGATSSSTLTLTVTGTNDAPTVTALEDSVGEDGPTFSQNLLSGADDVDDGATLNVVNAEASMTTADGRILVLNTHYTVTGSTFALTAAGFALFNDLDAGESDSFVFDYGVSDGIATTANTLTVTINGADDVTDVLAPTDIKFSLASTVGGLAGSNLAANSPLGSFTAVDADSASWTFALSGTDAALFTLSPTSGGSVNLLTGGAAIATGNYTIIVTATDSGGNSKVETFTISVGSVGTDGSVAFTVSTGSDISFGLNGTDTINGGDGEDALVGGQSGDTLNGGLGNDQLFGGLQGDIFVFNTAISPAVNVDSILDFDAAGTPNSDKIHLENAIFTQLLAAGALSAANFAANVGGNATDGNDFILYDTATGNLYYDADGTGAGAKILFAQLTVVVGTVDASDFVVI